MDVAGKQTKDSVNHICNETKQLMDKRRKMKSDMNARARIEYTELCKIIRKKIRENTRQRNMKMIEYTIIRNRSLKKTTQKFSLGKSSLISIKEKDDSELSNQEAILNRIKEFYEKLYSSNKPVEEVKQATASDAISSITKGEVKNAVKEMKKNTAPGPDSIEIDIIKSAGELLEAELANLYTRCIALQKIPTAWKESEMVLLFKKGDKKELQNYRPISLISHIYKIFTKIISKRLEQKLG